MSTYVTVKIVKKNQSQISRQDIQTLLKKRFGLAGLIHANSVMEAFSDPTNTRNIQDSLAPFVALEQLLQQNSIIHFDTLELINLIGKQGIFIFQSETDDAPIITFNFKDNALHIDMATENESQQVALPDIMLVYDIIGENRINFDKKVQQLLDELSEIENKNDPKKQI